MWSQCAKSVQNKIEARSEYQTEIKGNPINLLKAIKQHALNFQDRGYEKASLSEAVKTTLNIKQRENETLQGYTKRFKTSQEVMESHIGGPIELITYLSTMNNYDSENPV